MKYNAQRNSGYDVSVLERRCGCVNCIIGIFELYTLFYGALLIAIVRILL